MEVRSGIWTGADRVCAGRASASRPSGAGNGRSDASADLVETGHSQND